MKNNKIANQLNKEEANIQRLYSPINTSTKHNVNDISDQALERLGAKMVDGSDYDELENCEELESLRNEAHERVGKAVALQLQAKVVEIYKNRGR